MVDKILQSEYEQCIIGKIVWEMFLKFRHLAKDHWFSATLDFHMFLKKSNL